jgi:hypothetical protein
MDMFKNIYIDTYMNVYINMYEYGEHVYGISLIVTIQPRAISDAKKYSLNG